MQIHPTLRVNVLLGVRRVHVVADVPVWLVLRKQKQLTLQPLECVMGLGGASTLLPLREHEPVVMPPPSEKPSKLQEKSKQTKRHLPESQALYIPDDPVHGRYRYIVDPPVDGHAHLPVKYPEAEALHIPVFVQRAASTNPLPVVSKRTFAAFRYHILDLQEVRTRGWCACLILCILTCALTSAWRFRIASGMSESAFPQFRSQPLQHGSAAMLLGTNLFASTASSFLFAASPLRSFEYLGADFKCTTWWWWWW